MLRRYISGYQNNKAFKGQLINHKAVLFGRTKILLQTSKLKPNLFWLQLLTQKSKVKMFRLSQRMKSRLKVRGHGQV